jgi:hypothetical protein
MWNDKKVEELEKSFKRILTMPMSKSTFRQLQNAIFATADRNVDSANDLIESLLTGNVKGDITKNVSKTNLDRFFINFAVPLSVARDVAEKGEFVSLITSDIIPHPSLAILSSRIRLVDGEEFQFLTDPESTLQFARHFLSRLQEFSQIESGKNVLSHHKEELKEIRKVLDDLTK